MVYFCVDSLDFVHFRLYYVIFNAHPTWHAYKVHVKVHFGPKLEKKQSKIGQNLVLAVFKLSGQLPVFSYSIIRLQNTYIPNQIWVKWLERYDPYRACT